MTEAEGQRLEGPEELIGRCDGCSSPDGMWHPHRREHLCPRCGTMSESGDLAELHLRRLLGPTVAVWRAHWLERGAEPGYLDELLGGLAEEPMSRFAYRDGRPS